MIYRDFKTSNILLDSVSSSVLQTTFLTRVCSLTNSFSFQEYNSKLSDFGLAKDAPDEGKTHVSTRVMGTYGYAAPEYVMTGSTYMPLIIVLPFLDANSK